MDKFEYQPATLNASTVKMDGDGGFVGTAENVRSREWAREFGKRNLMSAVRLAREVEVDFVADFETMDALREAADADLYNLTPGTFVAQGEWKQRGYVLSSQPKGIHFGWVNTSLVIALLDGAWWRVHGVSLVPPSNDPPETRYGSGTGYSVRMGGAVNSEFTGLTIYGKSVQSGTPTPSSPIPVQVVEPVSGDSISVDFGGSSVSIDLNGNVLASLPDGTRDELFIDDEGNVTLTKRVGVANFASQTWTWQSSWLDWYTAYANINCKNPSSTDVAANALADGYVAYAATEINYAASTVTNGFALTHNTANPAQTRIIVRNNDSVNKPTGKMYFQLATEQTITLDPVTLPTVTPGTSITVTAAVTPEAVAVFEPALHSLTIRGMFEYDDDQDKYIPLSAPIVLNCAGSQTRINLGGNFLMGSSVSSQEYKADELTVDSDGTVTLTKRISRYALGALLWEKVGTALFRTTYGTVFAKGMPQNMHDGPYAMCDKFRVVSYSELGSDCITLIGSWDTQNNGKLLVKASYDMTADQFANAYVSGSQFYCWKPTPSVTELDPITMPGTVENAEVSISANVTPIITAEYQLAQYANYDYPHDYATDYQRPTTGGSVDTGRLVPCTPKIIFYGPVVDPEITVAGNKYKVTASVASGARIEVDGKEKTVKLIAEDGTVTDKFADALRGTGEGGGEYIFEPIPPGTHDITWDATFGVDIQWYDEVGEPPWSQS